MQNTLPSLTALKSASTGHLSKSSFRFFTDVYKRQVSVGSGNDGAGFGHANGSSYPADAELAIGYPEPSLSIDLWLSLIHISGAVSYDRSIS